MKHPGVTSSAICCSPGRWLDCVQLLCISWRLAHGRDLRHLQVICVASVTHSQGCSSRHPTPQRGEDMWAVCLCGAADHGDSSLMRKCQCNICITGSDQCSQATDTPISLHWPISPISEMYISHSLENNLTTFYINYFCTPNKSISENINYF